MGFLDDFGASGLMWALGLRAEGPASSITGPPQPRPINTSSRSRADPGLPLGVGPPGLHAHRVSAEVPREGQLPAWPGLPGPLWADLPPVGMGCGSLRLRKFHSGFLTLLPWLGR